MAIVALTSSAVQAMDSRSGSPTSVAPVVKPFNGRISFWFMQNLQSPVTEKGLFKTSTRPSTIIDVLQNANDECKLLAENDVNNAKPISEILHEVKDYVNKNQDNSTLDKTELSGKIFAIFKTLESKIPADTMIKTKAISENLAAMKQRFATELGLVEAAQNKTPSYFTMLRNLGSSADVATDNLSTTVVPTTDKPAVKIGKASNLSTTTKVVALATTVTIAGVILDVYYNNGAYTTNSSAAQYFATLAKKSPAYFMSLVNWATGETARYAAETNRLLDLKEAWEKAANSYPHQCLAQLKDGIGIASKRLQECLAGKTPAIVEQVSKHLAEQIADAKAQELANTATCPAVARTFTSSFTGSMMSHLKVWGLA